MRLQQYTHTASYFRTQRQNLVLAPASIISALEYCTCPMYGFLKLL